MGARVWATRHPPHVKGLPSQVAELRRAIKRLRISNRALVILTVLVNHADGAGFCWPKVETIVRESGYRRRSVFLALRELENEENALVIRYPLLRDPERYRRDLPQRARQGQAHSVYRLGDRLRQAAGLKEVDVAEHLRLRERGSKQRHDAPPKWGFAIGPATAADCTPDMQPVARPTVQEKDGVSASADCTPITDNGTASTNGRVVPSRTEGTHVDEAAELDQDEGLISF